MAKPKYQFTADRILSTIMTQFCSACGKSFDVEEMPFTCSYCGEMFCAEHRLPPNHSCSRIAKWRKRGTPFISTRTGIKIPISVSEGQRRRRSYKPVIALCLIAIIAFSYIQFPYLWENTIIIGQKWLRDFASAIPGTTTTPQATTTFKTTITTSTPTLTSPTTTTKSSTTVAVPLDSQKELVEYALELINNDRTKYGVPLVKLGNNLAAQKHAEELLANRYLSHWNLAGLKPYMRYTLSGGVGAVGENIAFLGFFYYEPRAAHIDPKTTITSLEYDMMYNDAESEWGHRDNILDKWHNKVNIGIAYDETTLALVQDFEDDYIAWKNPIKYDNGILSLEGKTTLGKIYNIALYYDPPPEPLTKEQLLKPPYNGAYSLGKEAVHSSKPLFPNRRPICSRIKMASLIFRRF